MQSNIIIIYIYIVAYSVINYNIYIDEVIRPVDAHEQIKQNRPRGKNDNGLNYSLAMSVEIKMQGLARAAAMNCHVTTTQ